MSLLGFWAIHIVQASFLYFYPNTLDHMVLGSKQAGSEIQLITMVLYYSEPFIIILPSFWYDLNNAESDFKHKLIQEGQLSVSGERMCTGTG